MVREITNISDAADNVAYKEFSGASTDEKPTAGVMNGSIFIESDTGDCYMFTEPGEGETEGTWTNMFCIKE